MKFVESGVCLKVPFNRVNITPAADISASESTDGDAIPSNLAGVSHLFCLISLSPSYLSLSLI